MSNASGHGVELGVRGVAVCARFAKLTCSGPALVGAWQMFRALPPRARTRSVYLEMMVCTRPPTSLATVPCFPRRQSCDGCMLLSCVPISLSLSFCDVIVHNGGFYVWWNRAP